MRVFTDQLSEYLGKEVEEEFSFTEQPGAGDFYSLLLFLKTKHIFPLILVDEFSYIKLLIDEKMINSAFLHSIRQYSFDGLASFIFAGTYDIKSLIKDVTDVEDIEVELNKEVNHKFKDLMKFVSSEFGITKNVPLYSKFMEKKPQTETPTPNPETPGKDTTPTPSPSTEQKDEEQKEDNTQTKEEKGETEQKSEEKPEEKTEEKPAEKGSGEQ